MLSLPVSPSAAKWQSNITFFYHTDPWMKLVFVAQAYRTFWSEADPGGLDYWSSQILGCAVDALCIHNRRLTVSAAFFVEANSTRTGSFVYRLPKQRLGTGPALRISLPTSSNR